MISKEKILKLYNISEEKEQTINGKKVKFISLLKWILEY